MESAIFGIICAVSSELYKDTAYYYAGFGDSKVRMETFNYTIIELKCNKSGRHLKTIDTSLAPLLAPQKSDEVRSRTLSSPNL